jgi:hypothetical protein
MFDNKEIRDVHREMIGCYKKRLKMGAEKIINNDYR